MPISRSRNIARAIGRSVRDGTITSTGTISGSSGSGVTTYSSLANLPLSHSAGDLAFVDSSDRLYISNGEGWYSVSIVNSTPSISSVLDSDGGSTPFTLSTEGANTVITVTATDSDGVPVTYSAVTDSDFTGLASISQSSNVFTVTPFSEDSATTTSGSVTFKASDGINVGTSAATFTLTFSIVNSNYTTLLVKAEGNSGTNTSITDSSSNSHTVTVNGDTQATSFSPYRYGGYSYYFDGNGDYLSISSHSSFAIGIEDFTMEAWVWNTGADYFSIFQNSPVTGAVGTSTFFFGISDTGSVSFTRHANGGSVSTATGVAPLNTWNHVAAVRDSTSTRIYVNGILEASTTDSAIMDYNAAQNDYTIGYRVTPNYGQGYLTDVRLIKGTALYTSAFTPPTDRLTAVSGTALLTCHLPYLSDGSTNGHTLTVSGDISAKPFSPYNTTTAYSASSHGGSFYVPGATGNHLTVPAGTDFAMGTGDFTHEFWIYPTGYYANYYGDTHGLVWSQDVSGTNWFSIGLGNPTNRNIYFQYGTSGGGSNVNSTGGYGSWIPNMWHHVAVVRNSGTLTVYLNGKGGTGVSVTQDFNNTTYVPTIGRYSFTDDNRAEGWISDYRVVKGTAIYTADFTPPTAPLSTLSGTVLHLKGTDAKVYDASQSIGTLTLYGNAASSTTQIKNASSSVYFDGTGDWIHLSASEQLEPLGNDFTFEWWWYPTTLSQRQWFFHSATDYWLGVDFQTSNGRGLGMWASSNGTSWNLLNCDAGGNGISNTNPTLNAWNHIAYTRSGSTFTLWLNGTSIVSVGSITSSIVNRSTQSKVIGSWAQSNHQLPIVGYIEDFRITKGLARYTSSFTPPTSELLG